MKQSNPTLPQSFALNVERGDAGLWFVTSDAHAGFLMAGPDLAQLLGSAPEALVELIEMETMVAT